MPTHSHPAISVLLPVRDGAPFLQDALDSLFRQTFADFEIIAVDDGSRDDTPKILAENVAGDPRLRVVRQERLGVVPALEHARALARAPYLARMDADDLAEPARLASQFALLENEPGLGACGTLVRYFPRRSLKAGARRYEQWLNGLVDAAAIERDLFVECPIAHPTLLLRGACLAAVGGYVDRGWPEDYDLVLRLWEHGVRFAKVNASLLRWRDRPDRLSRFHPSYSAAAFRRCKVHYLTRTLLKAKDGAVVWGAGPTGKAFARVLAETGARVRAFVDLDPRKIGQTIHGAPVLSPSGVGRYRGALVLAAVAQPGARDEVRAALTAAGFVELQDFVAVA
ncbi:MAG: glycosyltransferase [Gemmatimonadetes bacterium]|nr:glycosyltransferase [Gemmatimonadota bacterium]